MTSTVPRESAPAAKQNALDAGLRQGEAAQLAVLKEISTALAEQRGFNEIIDAVGDLLVELFGARSGFIALVDRDAGRISFPYWVDTGIRRQVEPRDVGTGLSSVVLETK